MVALGGGGVAGLVVAIAFGLIFLVVFVILRKERLRSTFELAAELDPSLLYRDLTLKDAERILAEFEAMDEDGRAALPEERLALVRRIQADFVFLPDADTERPDEDIVVEVENGPGGRVVVAIEETAEVVAIPPVCAGCREGEPVRRLPTRGAAWLKFPYCAACMPRGSAVRLALSESGVLRLVFARAEYANHFVELNRPEA